MYVEDISFTVQPLELDIEALAPGKWTLLLLLLKTRDGVKEEQPGGVR